MIVLQSFAPDASIINPYLPDRPESLIILQMGTNLSYSEQYTSNGRIITLNAAGGGVSDGDKGDVVVSGGGTIWTIDTGVIGTSKLGGDITTAGKALLDDADAAAQRTTLGLGTVATESTVPISKGGTGQTSAVAAFDALAPTTTGGDIIYHNGTDNVRLAAGTRYFQRLVTGGTTAQPFWNDDWYPIFAKTTQDVASQTVLQSDNTLVLNCTIFGTGTYVVRLVALLNAQSAAADVRYGFTTTGTITVTGVRRHIIVGAAAGTDNETTTLMSGLSSLSAVDLTSTSAGVSRVEMDFRLVCTVAGSWTFQFAQVTSNASASQRLSGSYLEFMKVE